MELWVMIGGCVLSVALIALAWIDLRTFRLPNLITFPLIAAGLAFHTFITGYWQSALIGAVAGYAIFVAMELAYKAWRGKAGLGRGDAKLLAAGGAWCGWMGLPMIVLAGSATAIAAIIAFRAKLSDEQGRIPFGPFLALGIGFVFWSQAGLF